MAACFDYKAAGTFADVFSNYIFDVLHLQSHVVCPAEAQKYQSGVIEEDKDQAVESIVV